MSGFSEVLAVVSSLHFLVVSQLARNTSRRPECCAQFVFNKSHGRFRAFDDEIMLCVEVNFTQSSFWTVRVFRLPQAPHEQFEIAYTTHKLEYEVSINHRMLCEAFYMFWSNLYQL